MSSDNGGFRLFDARQKKPRPEPRIRSRHLGKIARAGPPAIYRDFLREYRVYERTIINNYRDRSPPPPIVSAFSTFVDRGRTISLARGFSERAGGLLSAGCPSTPPVFYNRVFYRSTARYPVRGRGLAMRDYR